MHIIRWTRVYKLKLSSRLASGYCNIAIGLGRISCYVFSLSTFYIVIFLFLCLMFVMYIFFKSIISILFFFNSKSIFIDYYNFLGSNLHIVFVLFKLYFCSLSLHWVIQPKKKSILHVQVTKNLINFLGIKKEHIEFSKK